MAKSRRKSGGATRGRFKLKKMGKGMSAHRPKLGYRPKPKPKKDATDSDATDSGSADSGDAGSADAGKQG